MSLTVYQMTYFHTFERNLGLIWIDGLGGGGSMTGHPGSRLCTLQSNS